MITYPRISKTAIDYALAINRECVGDAIPSFAPVEAVDSLQVPDGILDDTLRSPRVMRHSPFDVLGRAPKILVMRQLSNQIDDRRLHCAIAVDWSRRRRNLL